MELSIRAMTPQERMYSYTQSGQIESQSGCIGHLRADMGSDGKDYFSSWTDHRSDLKTEDFKNEFDELINTLRSDKQYGDMLKDLRSLSILATNLTKIKVRNAAGDAVNGPTVSVVGKKKLSVSLNSIEKADYTLTIGKKFQDVNGNTLAADVSIPFTVNKGDGSGTGGGNGESPLSFVSAKVNGADLAGAELESSGAITITFDRGMTDNQAANFEQIGIYNAQGTKMEGASFTDFKKDADGNSFTVLSYENLPAGTYTLKLGKDLTANNGNTLGKAVNITFSVKGADNDKTDVLHSIIDAIVNFFKTIAEFFKNIFKK